MKIRNLFFLLILLPFQAGAEVISEGLFETINERLSYMEDVALFKAENHRPIEDVEREKVVIEKAKVSAHDRGLDPDSVEYFFKAQISVAKAIQFRHRADFLSQPLQHKPKDLQQEVRPSLIRLGDEIIEQMVMYIKTHGSFKSIRFAEFDAVINVKHVAFLDKQLLFKALQKVKEIPVN
ncbi:hypothetical protein A9Q81_14530 [Gammaproteobacteria bacterium 42_54_T18]|nr:hypothetical protein A9Q81_14530 [Gammaproteobacteria bacterium 42_54_T18]